MDFYTQKSQKYVDDRFNMTVEGIYFSLQPIYGYRNKHSSTSHISRYIITKSILNALSRYKFSNLIDIGGAEGYTAYLIQKLFGAKVQITDFSSNACLRAKEIFDIKGTTCDIHHLPFADNEFEVTVCSETIEHVTDYKKAIAELLRITSGVLIITVPHETPEIVAKNIRDNVLHGHIHYFDVHTLDYLKREGNLKYEKTLSPILIVPRVMAEAFKKPNTKLRFKLYNAITPLLKRVFGKKTAEKIINADNWFVHTFRKYGGITFVLEKGGIEKQEKPRTIKAADFMEIKVKEFYLKT
ncbi:MAG: class I SAM-dependent methyltransferase [Chitinophagales bacterium]|nr:class I SAM-dependent methyltransferase [Chitinophagales bacterium]